MPDLIVSQTVPDNSTGARRLRLPKRIAVQSATVTFILTKTSGWDEGYRVTEIIGMDSPAWLRGQHKNAVRFEREFFSIPNRNTAFRGSHTFAIRGKIMEAWHKTFIPSVPLPNFDDLLDELDEEL